MTSRFEKALTLIDTANSADPKMIETEAGPRPAELVYGERMSDMLVRIHPGAPEALQLAVRAQHLKRWTSPRSDFAMDRKGYHAWRNAAKRKHAEDVAVLLVEAGYNDEEIETVQSLVRKEGLKRNEDAQTLEDVACLVFLEHYFSAFAAKHDDEKLIGIIRKTWAKMSDEGHRAATGLPMDKRLASLIEEALGKSGDPGQPDGHKGGETDGRI